MSGMNIFIVGTSDERIGHFQQMEELREALHFDEGKLRYGK